MLGEDDETWDVSVAVPYAVLEQVVQVLCSLWRSLRSGDIPARWPRPSFSFDVRLVGDPPRR
jgi:hypothetical protein